MLTNFNNDTTYYCYCGQVLVHLPQSIVDHKLAPTVRIAALVDHCGGVGAFTMLDDSQFVGTVDLRIDFLHSSNHYDELYAESEVISSNSKFICTDVKCWNADRSKQVAIGRLLFGVYPTPVATKSLPTDYEDVEARAESCRDQAMNIATNVIKGGHIVTTLQYKDILLGNRYLKVLHGGVVAGFLERTGQLCAESLLHSEVNNNKAFDLPRNIDRPQNSVLDVTNLEVTYLKGAPMNTNLICEAIVSSRTSRLIRVDLACWNELRTLKIAAGGALFVLS